MGACRVWCNLYSRCDGNAVFTTTMPFLTRGTSNLDHLKIPEGILERIAYQTMLVCVSFILTSIYQ